MYALYNRSSGRQAESKLLTDLYIFKEAWRSQVKSAKRRGASACQYSLNQILNMVFVFDSQSNMPSKCLSPPAFAGEHK